MPDPLPEPLIDRIKEGEVTLFLGSGASLSARDKSGRSVPDSKQLAKAIDNRFLGGSFEGLDLARTAELAISETDLRTVQEFIKEILAPFEPSDGHKLVPKFVWKGIVTTNYDRLIERAYSLGEGLQSIFPVLTGQESVEEILRDSKSILLLKLHGCVTRTADDKCPFILSPDQYVTHLRGREGLFRRFEEWGREKPILFIGHSLADIDIRATLLNLTARADFQPRYYLACPGITEPEKRFWAHKKVTAISTSFEDTMHALDARIPPATRVLVTIKPKQVLPIQERFVVVDPQLSPTCERYLTNDVDYVRSVHSTEFLSPQQFYRGLNKEWSAIEQDLDVKRSITDTILLENLLDADPSTSSRPQLFVIKGHAGSGKTVLMRRIAWLAAKELDLLCLYVRPSGKIDTESIREILSVTNEPVYLFVDRVAGRVSEITALFKGIGELGKRLIIVAAERVNEWNVECGPLSPFVTAENRLKYLSEPEIRGLLELLKRHKSLGVLEQMTDEDRIAAFKDRAGRQLLVALHEATLGKQFEEIIQDEYNNIKPSEAKAIYLSICVLNRLDEPVRAGIISRIHHVPFEMFKREFLGPLEQVVVASENKYIRDYEYKARHPHIADIVFQRVLSNQEERFDMYLKALDGLDLGYTADSRMFWELVKAKRLVELFSNHDLIQKVFDHARLTAEDDPHLYHQRAIYEMSRASGNMKLCAELLRRAESMAPLDRTIKHSRSEFALKMAQSAESDLEKSKYFEDASSIARGLSRFDSEKPYAYVTLLKSLRFQLANALEKDPLPEVTITKIVQEFEQNFMDAIQRYPTDAYLLDEDARVAALLGKSDKAIAALQMAFERNPRSSYIALRLFHGLRDRGLIREANDVITKAIDANPNERRLHFAYAKILLSEEPENTDAVLYHSKRSFVPGDKNYDAQLIYARSLFLKEEYTEYKVAIDFLRNAYVDYEAKRVLRYPTVNFYRGVIAKTEQAFLFISMDGTGNWVHLAKEAVANDLWLRLGNGKRLVFRIAFTFLGTSATEISLEV